MTTDAHATGITIDIPRYHDVWMDNGVETFYKLFNDTQDSCFIVRIENSPLIINVADFVKFETYIRNAMK